MSSYGSWSVKGIDDRARAVAKEKARREGVTLGDYINGLLLQGHSEAGPRDHREAYNRGAEPEFGSPTDTALDSLTRRIEAAEARSTLAITGIDQSVLGLLARLENTEHSSASIAAEVEQMVDELRETQEALQSKVEEIDKDDSAQQNLMAMKALEDALGKLATHVYEESGLAQDETSAMKGRMEAGFADLTERVEGMEVKVENTLADAAARVEKAVESSELRAEGTSRHLSERFTAIESTVATKLSKVDDIDARMKAVEGDVSGALTSMEGTLVRVQERLNRAENTTDAALKALEQTFISLDERLDEVAENANPERAEAFKAQLEAQFDGLAAELRASVEESRAQLATEIEKAAAGENPELMGRLEQAVDTLKTRLVSGEERSTRALEAVNEQVNRVATGLDGRLRQVEAREDRVIDQVGAKMDVLADHFEGRIGESEQRSAAAIEQVGAQVATAINRVQARQDAARDTIERTVADAAERQDARLSQALANISERLSSVQSETVSFVSPVQQAIASLASRLESVENFTSPPHARKQAEALPIIPDMTVHDAGDETALSDIFAIEASARAKRVAKPEQTAEMTPETIENDIDEDGASAAFDAFAADLSAFVDNMDEAEPVDTVEAADADDFIAGLPDFDSESEQDTEASTAPDADDTSTDIWDMGGETADADYASSPESADMDQYFADIPEDSETDPLSALSEESTSPWEDGRDEARDSDIFTDDPAIEPVKVEAKAENAPPPKITSTPDTDFGDAPGVEVDQEATDYLTRARQAAIAAASEIATKPAKGRRSAASTSFKASKSAKPGTKTATSSPRSAMPVIVAASAMAVAAAGAGGWIYLRGMQNGDTSAAAITTADVNTVPPAATAAAPSARGAAVTKNDGEPVVDEDPDAILFDEDPITPRVNVMAPAPVSESPALPIIPQGMTLQQAANQGDSIAQFQYGEQLLGANNYNQGPEMIRRAADAGMPAAQYRLAKLHEKGIGVPRDLAQARAFTEKAARGGNVKAMHDLAVFFADGEGGPQSYAASVEWFRKAAEFGVVDSQYNLAVLYENGLGISPSKTEALYWYEVAARSGDASAPGNVETLRSELSLEVAQAAQRRASVWAASEVDPASNGQFGPQAAGINSREQVIAVQTVLNGLGYPTGTPDGLIGPGTRAAIRRFQGDIGLPVDGVISNALVDALNSETAT